MHLVGFIIRIYHNARSPERQTLLLSFSSKTQRDVPYKKNSACGDCVIKTSGIGSRSTFVSTNSPLPKGGYIPEKASLLPILDTRTA